MPMPNVKPQSILQQTELSSQSLTPVTVVVRLETDAYAGEPVVMVFVSSGASGPSGLAGGELRLDNWPSLDPD